MKLKRCSETNVQKHKEKKKKTIYRHVVHPGLIASHSVTADQLDDTVSSCGIQAIVVRHNLLTFSVGEDLIAAQTMTVWDA